MIVLINYDVEDYNGVGHKREIAKIFESGQTVAEIMKWINEYVGKSGNYHGTVKIIMEASR